MARAAQENRHSLGGRLDKKYSYAASGGASTTEDLGN